MRSLTLLLLTALSTLAAPIESRWVATDDGMVLQVKAPTNELVNWHVKGIVAAVTNAAATEPASSYLLTENFETPTTGFENAGWFTDGTITPSGGMDNQYIALGTGHELIYTNSTALGSFGLRFMVRTSVMPATFDQFLNFYDDTYTLRHSIRLLSTGDISFMRGTTTEASTTSGAWVANVPHYVWIWYQAGTGADGVVRIAFSTNSAAKPESGTSFATKTTGVWTSALKHFEWDRNNGTLSVDAVILDDAEVD